MRGAPGLLASLPYPVDPLWRILEAMQVTLELEPEVYGLASSYAGARGISVSAVISELVRKMERAPKPSALSSSRFERNEYGMLVVTGGELNTSERVKEWSEDPIDELSS